MKKPLVKCVFLSAVVVVAGCGDNSVVDSNSDEGVSGGEAPATAPAPPVPETPSTPAPPSPPGCGLAIQEVAIYQGVKITLAAAGANLAERPVDVVAERPALFRVSLAPTEGTAGEAVVRLTLRSATNTQSWDVRRPVALGRDESPSTTFNFDVPAAALPTDATYSVELLEPGACAGLRISEAPLRARRTGTLKVRLIPLRYETDGSNRLPDMSEAQLNRYRDLLMSMFPVAAVELSVRAEVGVRQDLKTSSGWSDLLDVVRGVRAQDAPAPDVYYYGLVAPADSPQVYCGSRCVAGIAYRAGVGAPQLRVGAGLGFTGASSGEAMAHELGHSHGRLHTPCGDPKEPDAGYPFRDGSTGVWGYDLRPPRQLIGPAAKDIMGYCGPRWISGYTYQALLARGEAVNGVPPLVAYKRGASDGWRMALVSSDGQARWGGPTEPLPGATSAATWLGSGGAMGTAQVIAVELADTDERAFAVPKPPAGATAVQLPGASPLPLP